MTDLSKRHTSNFPPNLFVIDPADCGCTDCIIGASTPANQLSKDQTLQAMLLSMTLVDRRTAYEKSQTLSSLTDDQRTELILLLMSEDVHMLKGIVLQ